MGGFLVGCLQMFAYTSFLLAHPHHEEHTAIFFAAELTQVRVAKFADHREGCVLLYTEYVVEDLQLDERVDVYLMSRGFVGVLVWGDHRHPRPKKTAASGSVS